MPDNSAASPLFLQLWFAQVGEITASIEVATQQFLSLSEQQRLWATRNTNKRREFLLSRALMRHALDEYLKPQQLTWQVIEQPDSLPSITNLPNNLHFSLTHSKGTICFALASCFVGIDLEKIRENRDFKGLAETVMNEEEIEFLKQRPEKLIENFYRIWCAKEACYKALNAQQQIGLSLKNIPVMPLLQGQKLQDNNLERSFLISRENAQFMLAIVMQKKPECISYHHFPESNYTMAEFTHDFGVAFDTQP